MVSGLIRKELRVIVAVAFGERRLELDYPANWDIENLLEDTISEGIKIHVRSYETMPIRRAQRLEIYLRTESRNKSVQKAKRLIYLFLFPVRTLSFFPMLPNPDFYLPGRFYAGVSCRSRPEATLPSSFTFESGVRLRQPFINRNL